MTKQQEFRKQTEEAKFEAFSFMCKKVTELEAQVTRAFEVLEGKRKQIADLTEQNTSLLTSVENLNKSVQELEAEVKEWKDKADLWCKTANLKDHNIMINKELEKENAELKCECRRCVYSDCPCILSDYGKDRNGICDHFKDVFDEIVELKEELKKWKDEWQEQVQKATDEGYARTLQTIQLTKAKELIENIIRVTWGEGWNYSLDWKVKAEQFISEVEK